MMKRLVVSADAPDAAMIAEAAAVIRSGGLVAFPTDTVYGIAADPRSDDAVARLFEFKGRDSKVAVPLIAGDIDQARGGRRLWPGRDATCRSLLAGATVHRRPGWPGAVARCTREGTPRWRSGCRPTWWRGSWRMHSASV